MLDRWKHPLRRKIVGWALIAPLILVVIASIAYKAAAIIKGGWPAALVELLPCLIVIALLGAAFVGGAILD